MACLGGILLFVALNMVKPAEVREVLAMNRFHSSLMIFTAVMVILTDFLVGVLSGLAIYIVVSRFVDTNPPGTYHRPRKDEETPATRSHAHATAHVAEEAAS